MITSTSAVPSGMALLFLSNFVPILSQNEKSPQALKNKALRNFVNIVLFVPKFQHTVTGDLPGTGRKKLAGTVAGTAAQKSSLPFLPTKKLEALYCKGFQPVWSIGESNP